MKTLTDYLDNARPSKIKALDKSPDGSVIEFDSSDFPDTILLLREALPLSLLSMKPLVIRNFDFLNERIVAIIDCAKKIGSAKAYHENKALYFIPKKISFNEKEFSHENGVISEMISVVLPVMMFSPRNVILNFEGLTEYQRSIDYLSISILPFLVPFCEIDLKILERGFMLGKKGRVQLSLKPRFRFNKSIYDEIIPEKYESLQDFIRLVREKFKSIVSDKGMLKPSSIRCIICAPKSRMTVIENDLKRPIDLVLRNSSFTTNIKVEYSDVDSSNASITLYSVLSRTGDIDFSKIGSFDIISRSIVINNLEKKNIIKLLQDVSSICEDVSTGKSHYDDLEKELEIYHIIFNNKKNVVSEKFWMS